MTLNIDEERIKLIKIVGDDTFNCRLSEFPSLSISTNLQASFLCKVLISTIKYPQVELYLKDLLKHYTINDIKNVGGGWSILHFMSYSASNISLGAFEIMINYGVDIIDIQNDNRDTTVHILVKNLCDGHVNNILNLFIKHGVNLNIKNMYAQTILDIVVRNQKHLNDETKNCIMTLVDFGARTNYSYRNNEMYDFIEYYKNSTIKPAIKK